MLKALKLGILVMIFTFLPSCKMKHLFTTTYYREIRVPRADPHQNCLIIKDKVSKEEYKKETENINNDIKRIKGK